MGKNVLSTLFGCLKPKAEGENGARKKKKEPKPRSEIRKLTLDELIKIDKEVTERVELLSNQLTAAFISSSFGHGKEGSGQVKKKRTREEIDKLQALINASQAERRKLHSVKLQLEEMKSNNSNDAAIAGPVASTSVLASTSVAGQVGFALTEAVLVEPQVVRVDEPDDNLFPGTHVVQDLLGSLICEVEVGREFEISSAFGKEDSPLNLQVLEDKLSKLADNVTKKNDLPEVASSRFTEVPSIDIKTAIPIEESSCISTEIPGCSTSKVDADDVDKDKAEEQVDEESKDEDIKMMKKRVTIKWLNLHD